MKTNACFVGSIRSIVILAVVCILITGVAYAQERDGQSGASNDDGERIAIVIEPDGRVIVNGEEVERGTDGVLRFGNEGGDVVIMRPDSGARMGIFAGPRRNFRFEEGAGVDPDEVKNLRDVVEGIRLETLPFEHFEPLLGEAAFLARESAETIKLERATRVLARKARDAEGAERDRLERELREKLMETLDAKLEARSERIARLEEQLNEERSVLETRRNSRDAIVDRRLRELLGEEDVLDW